MCFSGFFVLLSQLLSEGKSPSALDCPLLSRVFCDVSAGGSGEKVRASHEEDENCPSSRVTEVTDRVTQGQQGRAWHCDPPAKETVGGKRQRSQSW